MVVRSRRLVELTWAKRHITRRRNFGYIAYGQIPSPSKQKTDTFLQHPQANDLVEKENFSNVPSADIRHMREEKTTSATYQGSNFPTDISTLKRRQRELEKKVFLEAAKEMVKAVEAIFTPEQKIQGIRKPTDYEVDNVPPSPAHFASIENAARTNIREILVLEYPLNVVLTNIHTDVESAVKVSQTKLRKNEITPYLRLLSPNIVTNIVLGRLLYLLKLNPDGLPVVEASRSLGEAILNTVLNFRNIAEGDVNALDVVSRVVRSPRNDLERTTNEISLEALHSEYWDDGILIKLGLQLLQIIEQVGTVPVRNINLFQCVNGKDQFDSTDFSRKSFISFQNDFKDGKTYGSVVGNKTLVNNLLKQVNFCQDISDPVLNAMLCPPQKWSQETNGGFFFQNHNLFKNVRGYAEQSKAVKNLPTKNQKVFEALNLLGDIPWTLNLKVLEVIKYAHDNELRIGGLVGVPVREKLPEKPVFENYSPAEYMREKTEYEAVCDRIKSDFKSQTSKKMDATLKIKRAEELRNEEAFWFPFNCDFRGRVYPIPAHFNHVQNDISRSLLKFKEKKRLGSTGLRWLKIHLSSMFGNDKVSFDDREKWTDDKIQKGLIQDCAEVPIDPEDEGKRKWWCNADHPWQALAIIMELNDALSLNNPEDYMSNLTIHQDGSCNGLQHYAALGKDLFGATQVNLIPGEKPQDVYSEVCAKVQAHINDLANSFEKEVATKPATKLVEGRRVLPNGVERNDERYLGWLLRNKINRKVVKQTVMTSVYGVTLIGAKEQVKNRLHDINNDVQEKHGTSGPSEEVIAANANGNVEDTIRLTDAEIDFCGMLIAKSTLDAIGETFEGATKAMDWLKSIARVVTSMGDSVKWVSPVGLPVEQRYFKKEIMRVRTKDRSVSYDISNKKTGVLNKTKHSGAFPPNFVHSLDAAHLIMTTIRCHKEGIVFSAVHDSYWTHAADVDHMKTILKEEFVNLHKKNILDDLRNQVLTKYPQLQNSNGGSEIIPEPPIIDTLDLDLVKDSPYFFN